MGCAVRVQGWVDVGGVSALGRTTCLRSEEHRLFSETRGGFVKVSRPDLHCTQPAIHLPPGALCVFLN